MKHYPVMLPEMLEGLALKDGGIYIDGTFGAGGYSRAILSAANCRVFAIDRDPSTETFARELKEKFDGRFIWLLGNFSDMCDLLAAQGVTSVDGIVLDLGVSSMQLDQAERGFSFRNDGPLDMRMGDTGTSVADVIANADEAEIADILYYYGEEKMSRRVAGAIVKARSEKPITRTTQLAEIIRAVVGNKGQKSDPATRSFQALRIHVNQEFAAIENGLAAAERLLAPGGRLVVVTFHSLEDRIVKRFIHSRCGKLGEPSRHRPDMPVAGEAPRFFCPRPEKKTASEQELAENARSRSATLRIMERAA